MAEHNFKIDFNIDPTLYLDAENFMPDILNKLKPSITELIKKTKPYSIHGPT